MKTLFLILFVIVALMAVAVLSKRQGKQGKGNAGLISKRTALTNREQAMFFRLSEGLGSHIVLAQVAFSALLKTKSQVDRNRFDRKVADFVVLSRSFEVIAVVELDDASHKGREQKDAARQAILTNAGYRVIRYANVPDLSTLEKDFNIGKNLASGPILSAQPSM